jgi:two-component system chemotaxis sensor kinase CheA
MDMSQYLDMFLEESYENIQSLNDEVLKLEKNPDNKETINTIFRAAHTIKGMSASMGFNDMTELTHKMENVFDKFRNDELKVSSDVVNVVFKCIDVLTAMLDNIKEGVDEKVDTNDVIQLLDNIDNLGSNKNNKAESKKEPDAKNIADIKPESFDLNVYDKDIIKQAKDRNYNVLKVDVEIYKDCKLKSARAFLVYNSLEETGEIIKSVPSIEDLEQEKFDFNFTIIVITKKTCDEIKKIVNGISEIQKVEVTQIEDETEEKNSSKDDKKIINDKPKEEDRQSRKIHQFVKVDIERLDKLMNMVGELVIHRTRLEQISSNYKLTDLYETLEQVGRITSDLQDLVMKVRMLPIEKVFNRFPRMVRDLSMELHKDIDFIMEGEDTELDRTVIDEISEPLVHLIRNAVDHGIESSDERIKNGKNSRGTVKLIAYQEGNNAVIKVEDDGRGLNIEKIKKKAEASGIDTSGMSSTDIKNIIFIQGFSTSEKVTDVSGRGVGMDVVKTKISQLGGTVEVESEEGHGSSFIIKLPVTLSIIQALLVKIGTETFAISLSFIDKVVKINTANIKTTNGKEVFIYRDKLISLIRTAKKLNLEESKNKEKFVVIINSNGNKSGLIVDELLGQQEIVIKPVDKIIKDLKQYVGATILGDGLVTLILDPAKLI